ncbi:MAG: hypothetical protein GQ569_14450 [Methylococcaceae bacterium]|nr:hypothetical protein [Methylococcaceae bacterium]
MFEILRLFFDITLFRKAPQDIPASVILQRTMVFVYALISFLMLYISQPWFEALLQTGVEIALVWFFCAMILYWVGKPARFQQTFTALIGVDALISFFAFPVLSALTTPMPDGSSIPLLAIFVFITLILWHWLVTGYVLHHALSQPLPFGLGVALLYLMVSYQIIGVLFPEVVVSE